MSVDAHAEYLILQLHEACADLAALRHAPRKPYLTQEIFEIIVRLNAEQKVTMMLVEQNAKVALDAADYGYVMELGRIVMDDRAEVLAASKDIQEFYLGVSQNENQRGQRRWKQRKTWR